MELHRHTKHLDYNEGSLWPLVTLSHHDVNRRLMMKVLIIFVLVTILPAKVQAVIEGETKSCLEKLDGEYLMTKECTVNTPNGVLLYLETGEARLDESLYETYLLKGNLRVATSGLPHVISRWNVEIHPEGTVDVMADEKKLVIYSRKNVTRILTKHEEFVLQPQETIAFDRDGEAYYFADSEGNEEYYNQGGCSSAPGSKNTEPFLWMFASIVGIAFMRKRGSKVST